MEKGQARILLHISKTALLAFAFGRETRKGFLPAHRLGNGTVPRDSPLKTGLDAEEILQDGAHIFKYLLRFFSAFDVVDKEVKIFFIITGFHNLNQGLGIRHSGWIG